MDLDAVNLAKQELKKLKDQNPKDRLGKLNNLIGYLILLQVSAFALQRWLNNNLITNKYSEAEIKDYYVRLSSNIGDFMDIDLEMAEKGIKRLKNKQKLTEKIKNII